MLGEICAFVSKRFRRAKNERNNNQSPLSSLPLVIQILSANYLKRKNRARISENGKFGKRRDKETGDHLLIRRETADRFTILTKSNATSNRPGKVNRTGVAKKRLKIRKKTRDGCT